MLRFFSLFLAFTGIFSIITKQTTGQFYFKDIWMNQQLTKEIAILKNENVRNISIKSFDNDGEPSEGFYCERKINKNFTKSEMISRSNITQQSLLTSFYNESGWLTKTVDSTQTSLARSEYQYDKTGRITMITNFTKANDEQGGITETHQYIYNVAAQPEKMIRKRNNAELSVTNFSFDEKGNVIEEEEITKGRKGRKFLYYYDDKNRLTDVVHYNVRAKRLLPDYIFEYNQLNQVKQMISTDDNSSNYFIWKYTYNDQRLRDSEKCFSKQRRLLGSIQYEYK